MMCGALSKKAGLLRFARNDGEKRKVVRLVACLVRKVVRPVACLVRKVVRPTCSGRGISHTRVTARRKAPRQSRRHDV